MRGGLKPLPCPFCGEEASLEGGGDIAWHVACSNWQHCGCTPFYHMQRKKAVAMWNRRAGMENMQTSNNTRYATALADLDTWIINKAVIANIYSVSIDEMRKLREIYQRLNAENGASHS